MRNDKRVTRLLFGAFVLLTGAFVVSTIVQVATAVFGTHDRVGPACGAGLDSLARAVESGEGEKKKAWERYPEVAKTCETDPQGQGALAALARYERAASRASRKRDGDLVPVRRAVDSFIR